MTNYLLFGLSMAILFSEAEMATFTIKNNCSFTIWPAAFADVSETNELSNTGFELTPKASNSINVPEPWIDCMIWARTQCSTSSGRFTCATGDCGSGQVDCNNDLGAVSPATYAEFFGAHFFTGQDFYNINLLYGFNLPISITPQGGSGPTCTRTSCETNVNSVCPSELAVRGSDGNIIGCKSACVAFNQPQECCSGEFDSPERCQPTNYSSLFKNQCPQAYSYLYDQTSNFACDGGPNYLITFCP